MKYSKKYHELEMIWKLSALRPIIAGFGAILFGIILMCLGIKETYLGITSSSWESSKGRVTDIYEQEYQRRWFYKKKTKHVWYEYEIDGKKYRSSSVRPAQKNDWQISPSGRYKIGQNVIVFYNPKDKEESLLENGFDNQSGWVLGIAAIFIVAGLNFIHEGKKKYEL